MLPIHVLCMALGHHKMRRTALIWHKGLCWIAGIRIRISGQLSPDGPVIYVSNHSSYLDIPVLGAHLKACFVSKQDVASWPGLGLIAKLGGTVFVARQRMRTKGEADAITDTLRHKGQLILFPEGGTNDGNRILPFKSAFLSPAEQAVEGHLVKVQPIAITYTQINGLPIDRLSRPSIAWYGDMYLAPHVWAFLQLGRVVVNVDVHPAVTIETFKNRKEMSSHCEQVIRETTARRRREGLTHSPYIAPTRSAQIPLLNI